MARRAKGKTPSPSSGEDRLIEFLFSRGILPAYAFPRDLVALQVDRLDARRQVEIIERPQQGAAIALSEYAPGRLVVGPSALSEVRAHCHSACRSQIAQG